MKVLCYAPYSVWTLHTSRQVTILHALKLRGCEISYITCDGTFSECDMFQPSKGPETIRRSDTCFKCQGSTAEFLTRLGQPFKWLGRWLSPQDYRDANTWAEGFDGDDLKSATHEGWPIGEWVGSSVHSHYRTDALDFSDHNVCATYQRYLASGYLAAEGVNRALTEAKPDVMLLFNGRMAPMRIALELAKQHGVPTITEERGFAPGHLRLVRDTHCLDPKPFYDLCAAWKDLPLNDGELSDLKHLIEGHFGGSGFEMPLFAAPPVGEDGMAHHLGIDQTRTLTVLFMSSTDESQDQPETRGIFESQRDWVMRTAEWFGDLPDVDLIIRAHPNSGGKRSVGVNQGDLDFIGSLADRLPANVRLVKPDDDISSFDLIRLADVGLVWHSSLGLEMAMTGKPVHRAGAYWFKTARFMRTADDEAAYFDGLADTLAENKRAANLDTAIAAWRFAYCWFFRQSFPFPLVKQPDWAHGEPAYTSIRDLEPGKDESLDRICGIIMKNEPVHPQPEDRSESLAAAERETVAAFVRQFDRA